jgi:hypothetical protein
VGQRHGLAGIGIAPEQSNQTAFPRVLKWSDRFRLRLGEHFESSSVGLLVHPQENLGDVFRFRQLLGDNPDSRTGVRQVGGFSYTLEAEDPYAAARTAAFKPRRRELPGALAP